MAKICYIEKKFRGPSLELIKKANEIIADYQRQGFDLTLRQLYYQLVTRNLITNKEESYKNLGSLLNDARMAGVVDWSAIEDRTRNVEMNPHWDSPGEIVEACAKQFRFDRWEKQENRPEVWIEKEALKGVIEGVCRRWDVPYFACKGYTSVSEMHGSALRMIEYSESGQSPVIIHLGDHDPSGIDMTRDITDRMTVFFEHHNATPPDVVRIALNMDQIRRHNPPPNPAKTTDARFVSYQKKFGDDSWELDALDPATITSLIEAELQKMVDIDQWNKDSVRESEARATLEAVAQNWDVASSAAKKKK